MKELVEKVTQLQTATMVTAPGLAKQVARLTTLELARVREQVAALEKRVEKLEAKQHGA